AASPRSTSPDALFLLPGSPWHSRSCSAASAELSPRLWGEGRGGRGGSGGRGVGAPGGRGGGRGDRGDGGGWERVAGVGVARMGGAGDWERGRGGSNEDFLLAGRFSRSREPSPSNEGLPRSMSATVVGSRSREASPGEAGAAGTGSSGRAEGRQGEQGGQGGQGGQWEQRERSQQHIRARGGGSLGGFTSPLPRAATVDGSSIPITSRVSATTDAASAASMHDGARPRVLLGSPAGNTLGAAAAAGGHGHTTAAALISPREVRMQGQRWQSSRPMLGPFEAPHHSRPMLGPAFESTQNHSRPMLGPLSQGAPQDGHMPVSPHLALPQSPHLVQPLARVPESSSAEESDGPFGERGMQGGWVGGQAGGQVAGRTGGQMGGRGVAPQGGGFRRMMHKSMSEGGDGTSLVPGVNLRHFASAPDVADGDVDGGDVAVVVSPGGRRLQRRYSSEVDRQRQRQEWQQQQLLLLQAGQHQVVRRSGSGDVRVSMSPRSNLSENAVEAGRGLRPTGAAAGAVGAAVAGGVAAGSGERRLARHQSAETDSPTLHLNTRMLQGK
ncbi:unnamed protein product, partial [Closterium sp. NIES-53]